MQDPFDVAVVGAGPAGSVLAYVAARRGFRVALIDRQKFPRDKACGDGISPAAVRVAHRVGLAEIFRPDIPVMSVTVKGPDGTELHRDGFSKDDLVPGYIVPRAEYDKRLFDRALSMGAHDFSGMKFTATTLDGDFRTVELQARGNASARITTRLLVGADGANSVVRRALGALPSAPRHTSIAVRAYARSRTFSADGPQRLRMLFSFSRELLPGYAWIFPTGFGIVNIGVGVPLTAFQGTGKDLRRMLTEFVEQARDQGMDLEEPYALRGHHLPHFGGMPELAYPRAALIGDAASMINSFSGEGISYGMAAGACLAQLLPVDMGTGRPIDDSLARFAREFHRTFRAHITSALLLQKVMRSPTCAKFVIDAAAQNSAVLRDVTELLIGFGRIGVTTPVRIMRSRLRRKNG